MKKNKSLVSITISYLLLNIFIILVIIYAVDSTFNHFITQSFSSIEDILVYSDELEEDDFVNIPFHHYKNSDVVVFNEIGSVIYASSKEVKNNLSLIDLNYTTMYNDEVSYDLVHKQNDQGFYVTSYIYEGWDRINLDYIDIDKNFRVIAGGILPVNTQLTLNQINYMAKQYDEKHQINVTQYFTFEGEKRILAYISPILTEESYMNVINNYDFKYLIMLVTIFFVILLQSLLFKNKIIKLIAPLNNAINNYKLGNSQTIPNEIRVKEYQSILDDFKSLVNNIEQINKEKMKINEEKNQIIADISHDIKTPLTVILGYSKALNDNLIEKDKVSYYLDTIYKKAVLANERIESFYEYSQLEHPSYIINTKKTNINEFIRKYIISIYSQLESRNIQLIVEIPENDIFYDLDEVLFRRALDNLISNTIKYNDKDITVKISLSVKEKNIIITIADNGVGVDDNIKDKIFDPFITTNESRTANNGTGLGLSIVYKIIILHKGSISLKNKDDFKTVFEITLPL
ncbi:MAG: HAMP domain-containing sensor histidine kinase [Erysipelotrichaceae bacterium]